MSAIRPPPLPPRAAIRPRQPGRRARNANSLEVAVDSRSSSGYQEMSNFHVTFPMGIVQYLARQYPWGETNTSGAIAFCHVSRIFHLGKLSKSDIFSPPRGGDPWGNFHF